MTHCVCVSVHMSICAFTYVQYVHMYVCTYTYQMFITKIAEPIKNIWSTHLLSPATLLSVLYSKLLSVWNVNNSIVCYGS